MDFSAPVSAVIPTLEGAVFSVLARTTSPLSGSRIAELAGTGSNPGIRLALARMVQQGTVISESIGSAILYTANREHVLWAAIEGVVRAADRARDDIGARLAKLAESHREPAREARVTIALFGSVARGTSSPDSDIDLVAVFPTPGMTEADDALIDDLISEVPRWTGNSCAVFPLTRTRLAEMVRADDPMIASWKSDAITVYGPSLQEMLERKPRR